MLSDLLLANLAGNHENVTLKGNKNAQSHMDVDKAVKKDTAFSQLFALQFHELVIDGKLTSDSDLTIDLADSQTPLKVEVESLLQFFEQLENLEWEEWMEGLDLFVKDLQETVMAFTESIPGKVNDTSELKVFVDNVDEKAASESNNREDETIQFLLEAIELFETAQQLDNEEAKESEKVYQDLFTHFLQIPDMLLVRNELNKSSKIEKSINNAQSTSVSQAINSWQTLLQYLQQTRMDQFKNEQISDKQLNAKQLNDIQVSKEQLKLMDQQLTPKMKNALLTLMESWKEDPKWLSFLRGRLSELSRSNGNEPALTLTKSEGKAPIFIPASFLKNNDHSNQVDKQVLKFEGQELLREMNQNQVTDAKKMEKPTQAVRYQHLVEDVKELLKFRLNRLDSGETSQVRVRLHPEHLGQLDIRVTSIDGKIQAQLFATNQMAQEALERQIHQLRFSLIQQGIQVDRIEVLNHPPSQSQSQAMMQNQEQQGGKSSLEQNEQNEQYKQNKQNKQNNGEDGRVKVDVNLEGDEEDHKIREQQIRNLEIEGLSSINYAV